MSAAAEQHGIPRPNLFTPGFGVPPHVIVGRGRIADRHREAYASPGHDKYSSSIILGPRGAGKTVMLSALRDLAAAEGYVTVAVAAGTSGMRDALIAELQEIEATLGSDEPAEVTTKKSRHLSLGPLTLGREHAATAGTNRPTHLRAWFRSVADVVTGSGGTGVFVTVDEMHRADIEDLIGFANDYQLASETDRRNIRFAGASLPEARHRFLEDDRLSFFRRCAETDLPPLDEADAESFLESVIADSQGTIEPDAMQMLTAAAVPLPYRMQLVGDYAWRLAGAPFRPIAERHAVRAVHLADHDCEQQIYGPMWATLTAREQQYLAALADLGGESPTVGIADRMGLPPSRLDTTRRRLRDHACITVDDTADDRPFVIGFGAAMSVPFAQRRLREMRLNAEVDSPLAIPISELQHRTTTPVRRGGPRCGQWMPQAHARCVLRRGHPGGCRSRT